MAIPILCDNCGTYFMGTDNTIAKVDKKTGVVNIITKCPICKEKSIAAARDFDTITTKERSMAAANAKNLDAITTEKK